MKASLIIPIIAFGVVCILIVKGGNRFNGDSREEEIWDDIIEDKDR